MKSLKKFIRDEEGLTTVEYAIAGGLVGAGVITAFNLLGVQVNRVISAIVTALDGHHDQLSLGGGGGFASTAFLIEENNMKNLMQFIRDEEGLTTVEYAIAGGLVGAGVITAFNLLGVQVNRVISAIVTALTNITIT